MGRIHLQDYVCPRCSYKTGHKTSIRRHLYPKIRNRCPALTADIELTNEIKEYVLENRHYPIPIKPAPPTITQNIQQNNIINNFISNMDSVSKIKHFIEHRNIETVDFETTVENHYKRDVKKFLNDGFRGDVKYSEDNFMDMVSHVTKWKDIENMNIIYDSSIDQVSFAIGGDEWDAQRPKRAINFLIETLVIHNLSYYEIYLVRKIETGSPVTKMQLEECLNKYYSFIAAFNIAPFVQGKNDTQVMFNETDGRHDDNIERSDLDAHRVVDKFNGIYIKIRDSLGDKAIREMNKEVYTIIKKNHKINMIELNKHILEILRVDEEFKNKLVSHTAVTI